MKQFLWNLQLNQNIKIGLSQIQIFTKYSINMTEILLQESQLLHYILQQQTSSNLQRITEIQNLSHNLSDLFDGFTSSMNSLSRSVFKRLRIDENEDPTIIFLSKFIVDLCNELSKKFALVNKKIKNEVIQPLAELEDSQKMSYSQILSFSGELFTEIQSNTSFLNELNKNFSSNQNTISNTSAESKQEQQQFKKIFQSQMQKCNQNWFSIKNRYKKLLAQLDSINSFRCNFTIKMEVKLSHLLNKLVSSPHVEEALSGYEQAAQQSEGLSILIKQKIRDKLGKSVLLQEQNMEEFDGSNEFAYREKTIIDDFISIFTSFSNIKEDTETKHEKARTLILSNFHWGSYFLTRLRSNLHTEVKLSSVKFYEMTTIIKYLFASCAEEDKNQQTMYNIIYISYRMSHNGSYIIKELGKKYQMYWQNNELWYKLIEYLKAIREETGNDKKKQKNQKLKKAVKTGLNWISNAPHKIFTEKRIKSEKFIADAKAYDIMCEMNYFMSRMELSEKFIFDFIVEASGRYGVQKQNTKKLLKFHYFNKQNILMKPNSHTLKRKKRQQEKYKNIKKAELVCICIGKCLKYLPADKKLLDLRLVNRAWADQLNKKIGIRFLIQEKNQKLINKIRLKVYTAYCPSALTKKIFNRMLDEIPEFTEHIDIIKLDARRSLAWDESLRQNLVSILKCYAFYHPNVGYLQGMNYLCENILKLTDQQFSVYRIFEYLMNNPFYGMYSANFDGLKTKIYQFMRIVQIQKPKLYDHFQTEKLEGQHFVLPWAITLWGEMSGDLCWVMWDGFICKGWKWWFKTVLWLLNILEPELLKMNFQEMMKCFSQLSTGLLNMNMKQLQDFGIDISNAKDEINKIKIHESLLKEIEKQYKIRVEMVNQYLKKLLTPKKLK